MKIDRRGWDSNPRYAEAYNRFRVCPIQPLWHLSGGGILTDNDQRGLYPVFPWPHPD